MLTLKFKVSTIFNPAALEADVRRRKRRAIVKMAAFVRTRMRSSIKPRKRGGSAPDGQPPYSRKTSKPNLRTILFDVDFAADDAIIGPIEFRGRHTSKPAPELLEHGGSTTQRTADGGRRRVRIRAHPFAEPALSAEIGKFPELLG